MEKRSEKGQTLVMVVLAFTAFIAMLVLVLDGGNAFFRRRIAQDAADAGALAGAKYYCLVKENVNQSQSSAQEYVEVNDAVMTNYVVNTSVQPVEVTVDVKIDFSTFFGALVGRPEATATATATAGCFPPELAAPLPVAWSCQPDPDDENECLINVWGFDGAPSLPEHKNYYYLIAESSESPKCVYPPNTKYDQTNDDPGDDFACGDVYESGEIDCDLDNDCSDDVFGAGDKTWLDLDGGGTNTTELNQIIRGEKKITVSAHTWVGSGTGEVNSLYKTLKEYEGDQFIIPIFNHVCGQNIEECAEYQRVGGDIVYTTGTGKQYYHIKEFALFRITCVRRNQGEFCPYYDSVYEEVGLKGNEPAVEGYFLTGTSTDFGSFKNPTGGIFDQDTGTYIIKLID